MKREHPDTVGGGGYPPPSSMAKGKPAEDSQDAGVDELLAALGYKVRASDMADVAQKLEQLEMAMGSSSGGGVDQDDTVVSHLASDTVHYNPSDLSAWLENMLSELNAPPPPPPLPTANFTASSQFNYQTAAADPDPDPDPRKKMRTSSSPRDVSIAIPEVSSLPPPPPPPLPMVVVDPQESGVRLIHTLMACADAIEKENYAAADSLLKQIPSLAASQGGAMRKVAGYFAEALGRRIYRSNSQADPTMDSSFSDILRMHFYESCPYLKFAHFTANQAILEAFSGCSRVHVVDLGMEQGMQWPALMQALALRPGGPPSFRLTGIAPPQPDNPDALQQVGWKLAQLADTVGVEFEYRGLVVSSLANLEPHLLLGLGNGRDKAEAVAVNSVFELHRLLAQTGAIDKVLDTVKAMAPKIFTMVEQEANHNADRFSERFTEALHYYSAMFDSLEGGSEGGRQQEDQMMTEIYLGREICDVVACEGAERTERHQTAAQWKGRMARAGFEPVCLGSDAFKQASMLLALFAGGDGYRVEEREGCLTLGWHTRPLIATSAWRLAGS